MFSRRLDRVAYPAIRALSVAACLVAGIGLAPQGGGCFAADGGGQSVARPVQVTLIARCSRGLGLLALLLAFAGCASAGGGGGSGGGGQCNDGSWCGNRLDRDQDGLISQGEWDDAFNAADTDHDGQVSQGEFQGAGGNWGGGGRGGGR